jgi:hypothetical protein
MLQLRFNGNIDIRRALYYFEITSGDYNDGLLGI